MLTFKIHNYVIYVFYRVSGYHAFGTRIRDYVRFVLNWKAKQKCYLSIRFEPTSPNEL